MNGIPMLLDEAWWGLAVLILVCLLCLVGCALYYAYVGIEKVLLWWELRKLADYRRVPAPLVKHQRANPLARPKPLPSLQR